MKNLFLTFTAAAALICMTFSQAQAQDDELKVRLGVKGGVNFSNLYTENVDENNALVGFNLGVFAKLPITNFLAIQPELYFTTKGNETTYNNTFVNGTARFNLNYIELPVLAVVNVSKYFNIHAGPYAAFLLSGKASNKSNVTLFNFEDKLDTNDYNKLDFGLALGVGADLGGVGFGIRYNYGLTKVGKERTFAGTNYTFPDGKNSVLSLYASFSLN